MFRSLVASLACASLALILAAPAPVAAQEKSEEERFQAFSKMMTNVKLVGSFTVVGQAAPPKQDGAYVIKSVRKLPEGDYWVFDALVEHEDKEMPLQIPIEVKWSGDTPVITLENLTIPALGTFSARIVLYRDAYAGMWVHGPVKGHMYGVIEKAAAEAQAGEAKPPEKKQDEKKPGETKPEEKKP
ncbi:MAG TPA: hypothetical protein VGN57_01965 [Pirellulaceae bacterium]|jgi:hypothetical protein|nr:hypothetical protein [Pirellulaceae bacterium]